MKRNLMLLAAMTMSVLCGSAAIADQLRIDFVMRDYGISRPDAAAVAMLSASLHFGERDVVYWARDCGRSVRDVGPAYVISYYTHEPVERIWRERRGRSWYDYGIDCGIDWGRFNRLDISYGDFDRMLWLNLSNTAYGCDEPLWDDLCGQGLSFPDVVLTIVLGDGYRDRCDYYAYEYRNRYRDWDRMWSAAGRDPHVWVGYRDGNWRTGDYNRQLQDRRSRDRQLQDQRNRQEHDTQVRDRQLQRSRDRQLQDQRDRQRQDQLVRNRQEQDRQARDQQLQRSRDRQLQDQRDRQRQDQLVRSRQEQDRQTRDEQLRRDQGRQVQDRQNRRLQDTRDTGRNRRDNGNGRSNDRSQRDNQGRKDRNNSDNHGR